MVARKKNRLSIRMGRSIIEGTYLLCHFSSSKLCLSVPAHVSRRFGGDGARRFRRQQGSLAIPAQGDKGEAACSLARRGVVRSPMLGETRVMLCSRLRSQFVQLAAAESELLFASIFYGAWSAEYMATAPDAASGWVA